MKNEKLFTIILLICSFIFFIRAGENKDSINKSNEESKTSYRHYIGVGGGASTGFGLSYKHWFKNDIGFQINICPYMKVDEHDETEQMLSFGLSGYKSFIWTKRINFFAYAGLHTFYYYDSYTYSYYYPYPVAEEEEYTYLIAGLGPGFELHFWRLSISLMAGIGYYAKLKESKMINLTGEGALHFCF